MARYGCTITVAATKIPSSQSNFVWLATEVNFPTAAVDGGATSILNGGGNLRCYTDSTKTTQLPIEVVSFVTGGTPQVQVWGMSPILAVGSTVYIEADTVATTQPPVTDAYGRNAVWQDYAYVNHMMSASQFDDATGNNTGTINGTLISDNTSPAGGGVEFTGTQYVRSPSSDSLVACTGATQHRTVSFWIKTTSTTNTVISEKGGNAGFIVQTTGPTLGVGKVQYRETLSNTYNVASQLINDNKWHLVQCGYNGQSNVTADNIIATPSSAYPAGASNSSPLDIGSRAGAFGFSGSLSEFRISDTYLSDDYRAAEYNNQSDAATFWATSAWEDQDAGGGVTGDIAITINSPSFSVSGSATLPNPIGDISITIDSPLFALSGSVTLPQPSGDISITVDTPTFNASGSATLPFPQGNVAFTVASPLFSATGSATQPNPSGDIALVVAKPEFSATGSATLPSPAGDIDFTIDEPLFAASGSASLPYPVGNASITISEPLFSASGSATLPQPSATVAFDISKPVFYATGTVSGLAVPVGITLTPAFGSNVLKLQAGTNIIKL